MPKFGLFDPKKPEPIKVWEADYMRFEKPYMRMFNVNPNGALQDIEVATTRLKPGFSVEKLDES